MILIPRENKKSELQDCNSAGNLRKSKNCEKGHITKRTGSTPMTISHSVENVNAWSSIFANFELNLKGII